MSPDPKESKQTKSQQIPTKVIGFTPLKTNMKPEDAILKKETDRQKTIFWLPRELFRSAKELNSKPYLKYIPL